MCHKWLKNTTWQAKDTFQLHKAQLCVVFYSPRMSCTMKPCVTPHIHAICSLEPDRCDILEQKRSSSSCTGEDCAAAEVYDQIYQYKSRNSINPLPRGGEERKKTDKVRGRPGSSVSLCAGRETASAVGGRHNQTGDTDREQTRTGRHGDWWVSLLAALIV